MPIVDCSLACSSCGSSLRGADLHGRCSSCGQPVGETLNLVAISPIDQTVAGNLECITCGYNLRTLPVGSVCPECASPVTASLRPDELRFANLRWLRRVRRGLTLLVVAWIGMLATSLLSYGMTIAMVRLFGPAGISTPMMLLWMAGTAATVILCIAVFEATAADPHTRGRPERQTARRVARVCTLGAALLPLLNWMLPFLPGPARISLGVSRSLLAPAVLSVGLIGLVVLFRYRRMLTTAITQREESTSG